MSTQKKGQRTQLVEGISKRIRKEFEAIVEEIDRDHKLKQQQQKDEYQSLCKDIEQLATSATQCFSLLVGDNICIAVANRRPKLLIKYARVLLEWLLEQKQSEEIEKKRRRSQIEATLAAYNQNNIYELLARKNIEFLELQTQVKTLSGQIELSQRKTELAEEMTKQTREKSEEMLKVYRENFVKMTSLLQKAQNKETELLQTNRFLNEEIQNLNMEFEMYKKNYKAKTISKDSEGRLKERLEKEYEQKLKQQAKQIEQMYKSIR